MANKKRSQTADLHDKYIMMQESAKYDIKTSAETIVPGLSEVKAAVKAKKQLPKVPKVFLSNECIFNCAYCDCRSGNECKQTYQASPRELAELSIKTAQNSRSGIFISSAIYKTPDYTCELINETLRLIRMDYGYRGFLHAKVMPGTDPDLIRQTGLYADRLSVNIEVAKSDGYQKIARNKNKVNILSPMAHISSLIRQHKSETSVSPPKFATSQTTQLMAGSTDEDDYTILNLAGALYKKYNLSRVYYTSFTFKQPVSDYDLPVVNTPAWRVRRLYQADMLIKHYGFSADEITPADARNLSDNMDPKCAWAMRNMHMFPIEINTADYEMLLKIPGIGTTYAKRIIVARRLCSLSHDSLKQLGISLKRAQHFITCSGKYKGSYRSDLSLLSQLLADPSEKTACDQLSFYPGQITHVPLNKPVHI